MKIAVLIAGIVGSLAGFYLGAENGLTPAADGSESFTVGFLAAVLGALVGLVGAGLSMFKPKLASILLLVGGNSHRRWCSSCMACNCAPGRRRSPCLPRTRQGKICELANVAPPGRFLDHRMG